MIVTDQHQQQFREEGYFFLEKVVPNDILEVLRNDCDAAVEQMNQRLDAGDPTVSSINHRDQRYFIPFRYESNPQVRQFLFGDLMVEICRATIGDDAFLFLDQHVVKAPGGGMKFSWHQDSGYVGFDHTPYLTTWTALDDMDEQIGTVRLLPFSRAGTMAAKLPGTIHARAADPAGRTAGHSRRTVPEGRPTRGLITRIRTKESSDGKKQWMALTFVLCLNQGVSRAGRKLDSKLTGRSPVPGSCWVNFNWRDCR